jgi:hypothetical protein
MSRLGLVTTLDSAFATDMNEALSMLVVDTRFGQASVQSGMRSMADILMLKFRWLRLEIGCCPE